MVWDISLEANKLRYSLRTKLTLSYILIILICVVIISIASNILLEKLFRDYVINQQEQQAQDTVLLINQRYNTAEKWDVSYIEDIGMNALENGMILKIKDADNNVIWDATIHNNGLCQQMLTSMRDNMQNYFSEREGGYVEKSYTMTGDMEQIGTVTVGYYGPYYYTDSDLYFIKTINNLLVWTGIVSLILALILGVIISNQLSKPISRVIDRAGEISQGLYDNKIIEKSKTKEIRLLVDTMNNLADTLKRQQEFSRQASADIAHELRTPLTTVQGNLEAVIDGVMELDGNRLEVLHDEILRINRLVDDLGKLARYESESFVLNKTKFDISELIKRSINAFESDFIKENKEITFCGQSEEIVADKDKINQVIVNLISNALKFTKSGEKVEICVNGYRDTTEIIVKDNGVGIAEEELPNIFERFYRADKSRNRNTGGAGIGLTIVKSIILAHKGTIQIKSMLGVGSEFIIILPK